ncbi:MAG: DUF4340 domain-containing protein [Xanthomonadales bacterium]|nr:DUF4340 domain-containing protein [Xanthomonadales bacterium]
MNQKRFALLAVSVLVVIALVVLLVPRTGSGPGQAAGAAVLPGLDARVNDLDRISVSRAGGETVTLVRGENGWVVSELDGYPADWDDLRMLLADLAQMTVTETKTANPAYHSRLGVEDLSSEGAAGIRLDLHAGEDRWSLIVGNEAARQDGLYMRIADSDQSVLADRVLDLPRDAVGWADDMILDVGPGLVAEVSIRHPDGEVVRVSKVSADQPDFTLQTLPEGREPQSNFKVNSLANPFSMLRMEAVRKDPGPGDENVITVKVVLFSGERYELQVFDWDDERWLRIRREPGPEQAGAESPDEAAPEMDTPDWQGWVFQVSENRFNLLASRVEDLLKPLDANNDGGSQ